MKIFKIIFFHIYNSYYKDGNYSNDIPHLTAYGLAGCSWSTLFTTLILIAGQQITGKKLETEYFLSSMIILLIAIALGTLYKKRYEIIYCEIKESKWDTTHEPWFVSSRNRQ